MTNEPENLILRKLDQLRDEMAENYEVVNRKLNTLDHKVGTLAQTLVGMQRDIKRLVDTVGTLGAAVDEHTHRLDRIEQHFGPINA